MPVFYIHADISDNGIGHSGDFRPQIGEKPDRSEVFGRFGHLGAERKNPGIRRDARTFIRRDAMRQAVALSSFFMIEKMNRAESRHSTIRTLQTIHSAMPLPQR